jgi:D-alanyl-D-alanine carboxypeptidase (penicillin-binding protein 5/6)
VDYSLTLPSSVAAPVKKGQPLGTLRVTVGENPIAEVPVCAAEDVPRIGVTGIFKKLALSLFGI